AWPRSRSCRCSCCARGRGSSSGTPAEAATSPPAPRPASTRAARGEQGGQLLRVLHGVVAVAVVHELVHLAGAGGEVAEARHPLAQLVLAIGVPEALRRADAGPVPRRRVAAVEAD